MNYFLFILCLFPYYCLYAQEEVIANLAVLDKGGNKLGKSGWSVSASWSHGRIVKHNERFKPIVRESSDVWELNFARHLAGNKAWHERLNYPVAGISLLYADLGDTAIFGKGFGVLASVLFQTRFKHWAINYRLGTGLGYLTRFYHPITNSTQNAIGSHVNNVTQLSLGGEYRLSATWRAIFSLSFTHFSNGRTQTPNLGINIPAYGFGLRYLIDSPHYSKLDSSTTLPALPILDKRVHIGIKLGQGIQEWDEFGGPKYPIHVCQLFAAKRLNAQWQLHLGIETDYYWSNHYIGISQGLFTSADIYKAGLKVSPYIGAELFLGRVSIYASVGGYAYNKVFVRGSLPTKFGLQYYFTPTDKRVGRQLYIGAYLKSHIAVADFTELGIGYLF